MRNGALWIGLALLLLAGCNKKEDASGGGSTTGQKTIRVLALNWPQATVEQRLADEIFTKETGIKVILETNRYDNIETKMNNVMRSQSAEYDIVHYDSQWLGSFVAGKGLERLDTEEYLNSSDAKISFDDFVEQWAYRSGKYPTDERDLYEGKFTAYTQTPIYGFPWSNGAQILFYRSDLVTDPSKLETWQDFAALAKSITKPGFHGAVTHASRSGDYICQDFLPILWSFGGDIWDAQTWRTDGILNSPENVRALEFFCTWMNPLAIVPKESANWGNEEVFNAFSQGQVGMGQFWATFGAFLEDPKQSKVMGKMAYTIVPGVKDPATGQIRRAAIYGCQASGISAFSKNKKEAWLYLQWLMSKETQQAMLDDPSSALVSGRKDLLEYQSALNSRNKAVVDSIPFTRDFWNIPDYSEMLSILQRELNLAFVGQKAPKAALDTAAKEIQTVLDNSPHRPGN